MTEGTLHPATENILQFFEFDHLPDHLKDVSRVFKAVAEGMVKQVGEGPETTVGLRKLLEAKDCFVRQAVISSKKEEAP